MPVFRSVKEVACAAAPTAKISEKREKSDISLDAVVILLRNWNKKVF